MKKKKKKENSLKQEQQLDYILGQKPLNYIF